MVTGTVAIDMARVRQRKRDMVEGLIAMHLELVQGERRRIDHGRGAVRRPENAGGAVE